MHCAKQYSLIVDCRSVSPDGENGARPPKIFDVDPERRRERERQLAIRQAEQELAAADGAVKEKPKEDPKAEVGVLLRSLLHSFPAWSLHYKQARQRVVRSECIQLTRVTLCCLLLDRTNGTHQSWRCLYPTPPASRNHG